jgi:hypothetical protein
MQRVLSGQNAARERELRRQFELIDRHHRYALMWCAVVCVICTSCARAQWLS